MKHAVFRDAKPAASPFFYKKGTLPVGNQIKGWSTANRQTGSASPNTDFPTRPPALR